MTPPYRKFPQFFEAQSNLIKKGGERMRKMMRRRVRGGQRRRHVAVAATAARLVIYTESYLHLNVFIFSARPRSHPHSLNRGFISGPFPHYIWLWAQNAVHCLVTPTTILALQSARFYEAHCEFPSAPAS